MKYLILFALGICLFSTVACGQEKEISAPDNGYANKKWRFSYATFL